ncbi:hypothetical protein TraAM80_08282 [Trypanosoma rangeli]|uniref:Uncharacterized protein n=1 Tax=Trypanosoma rangeli TaxID=5698 RepID=A0A3R7LKZ6_TRYRA|nr:uncharacterized protein TraAM80_08282 [Trypanosoma rangeli]RNE99257.1 hypothetical protein TraAM80_08282 [Trypanosoma rangeli]|eukprot:RNE99257.1 hypothetical protein TraAM80_08282 [Trypanosoma rangeli]
MLSNPSRKENKTSSSLSARTIPEYSQKQRHLSPSNGMPIRRGARDAESDDGDCNDTVRTDKEEEEEDLRPHPSPAKHWTEWAPRLSSSSTASLYIPSSGLSEASIPHGKLASTERELECTKELLLQYKHYVERRLFLHIQKIEKECAKHSELCKRLKRDNALLLEELERYRASRTSMAVPFLSNGIERQPHSPPLGYLCQAASVSYPSPLAPPPPPLPKSEDSAKEMLHMLRSHESRLLGQLKEERTARERLEVEHAAAVRQLQEQVAELEGKMRVGIDAVTIQTLRKVLARRDDEIRKLRKLHGFSIVEALEEGSPQDFENSFIAELRLAARDAVEFVAAMTATTTDMGDTCRTDLHLKEVEDLWGEVLRVTASPPDDSSKLPQQLWPLMDIGKSLRCAIVAEHNQLALFVGQLLQGMEEVRGTLAREQQERQVDGDRLRAMQAESTALVQRLPQELGETAQCSPSRVAQTEAAELHKRQHSVSPTVTRSSDVATQTLPSAQLSHLQNSGATSLLVPHNAAYKPISTDLGHLLHEMEALERDNAAKSALIAKLQHQRERFLGDVDAELAVSLPTRKAMTNSFAQYLLE